MLLFEVKGLFGWVAHGSGATTTTESTHGLGGGVVRYFRFLLIEI